MGSKDVIVTRPMDTSHGSYSIKLTNHEVYEAHGRVLSLRLSPNYWFLYVSCLPFQGSDLSATGKRMDLSCNVQFQVYRTDSLEMVQSFRGQNYSSNQKGSLSLTAVCNDYIARYGTMQVEELNSLGIVLLARQSLIGITPANCFAGLVDFCLSVVCRILAHPPVCLSIYLCV